MDKVAVLRKRLDLEASPVPDADLQLCLDVTMALIVSQEPNDDALSILLVDESHLELSIKVWDLGTRGTVSMDEAGEWQAPPPSATRGLIRSVQGLLAPATKTGMTGGFA